MKKQILDTIIYNGVRYELKDSPLYSYLVRFGYNPFYSPRSSCTRGYIAQWEIKEGKLFLIDFIGFLRRKNKVDLSYLFPNKTEVLADWISEFVSIVVNDNSTEPKEKIMYLGFIKGVLIEFNESQKGFIDLNNLDDDGNDLPF